MKKAARVSLLVLTVLIALLLIFFAGVWYYVKQHKQETISFLVSEAEKGLNKGTLHIGDVSVGFKHSFPLIALTIDSVYLRDSLWSRHHHDLVAANRIFATIDFWQLLRGKINIGRLELDKPEIYIYTDSLGYSNTSVFKKTNKVKKNKAENQPYPLLDITDGTLSIDAENKHKYFGFRINNLECDIREKAESPVLSIDVNLDCLVQQLTFNRDKGPFLEHKTVQGAFQIAFNKDSKILDFADMHLAVDQQPFVFAGTFRFAEPEAPFVLSWETKDFSFRKGVSFLATNLRKTLTPYDIADSIAELKGSLDNTWPGYPTPLIHLWLHVVDRTISSPFVTLQHASFTATFNNEAVKNLGHEDSNTVIRFSPLQGNWENLHFHSDSVVLSNLRHPRIKMNVISDFQLGLLNHFLKGNDMSIKQGSGKIDLAYSGSLEKPYDSTRLLYGHITLDDAAIQYAPGNLLFSPVSGLIRFTGKDMIVDNLRLHTGSADMNMNGKIENMFYFLNHPDKRPSLFWSLSANRLNLDDFMAHPEQAPTPVPADEKKSETENSVSDLISRLKAADFHFNLNVNKLTYKKLIIDTVHAALVLNENAIQLKDVRIQRISLPIDDNNTHKFYGFKVNTLSCIIHEKAPGPVLAIDVNLDCLVQQLTFNREKGPFLQNKTVRGKFSSTFNKDSKILDFANINLAVDQQPFVFTGQFQFAKAGTPFVLSWETRDFSFRKGLSFLATNLRKTLEPYDISGTIEDLRGSLDNSQTSYSTPLIHLWLKVVDQTITSPFVVLNHASFTATFNNEAVKNGGHEDSNTVIHFSPLEGSWGKLSFQADSVVLHNLIHPRIKMQISSDFQMSVINGLLNENEMVFTKGSGKINLAYSGSLEKKYDSSRRLTGNITLTDAGMHYLPRNLLFAPVSGVIRFTGKDMIVDHLQLHSGSSDLDMNGKVNGIFDLLSQSNDKQTLYWTVSSNRINLDDFTGYLQMKKKPVLPAQKKSTLALPISDFVSNITAADFNVSLKVGQLSYKKFVVDSLQAALVLNENAVQLKDVHMQHGGGRIDLQGLIRNEPAGNPFTLHTRIKQVNVSGLFYAFDDFGQKSLTDKNIQGSLSAEIKLDGELSTKAQLVTEKFTSSVAFNLRNGALINFEPIAQIQEKILKKRDLSDIRFADLYDSLEVRGDNITINRMEIRSSVLSMFVNGIYNLKTGPDFSIQVPLSNLKANKDSVLLDKGIHSHTGVSARLWVRRAEDGKLEVSWDPFNKANKEMKKNESAD